MSRSDIYQRLDTAREIELTVKGRKSGKDIPRPVWFVHEDDILYLMPNYGSDTNWYKNFLANQTLKISISGQEISAGGGKAITDSIKVGDIMNKFSSKYGNIREYYPKPDVAVEVSL